MRQMVLQINEKKAEKKLKVLNIALLFNFKKSKQLIYHMKVI